MGTIPIYPGITIGPQGGGYIGDNATELLGEPKIHQGPKLPLPEGAPGDKKSGKKSDYQHEEGFGGAGGSPVKFIKREGSLENKNMNDCSRHMRGK